MDSQFPCNGCGVCCKQLARIPELAAYDRGDGTCKHLLGTRCTIYETRPTICRVDEMYETVYKNKMSKEQFFYLNLLACKQLQIEADLPENEHVKI